MTFCILVASAVCINMICSVTVAFYVEEVYWGCFQGLPGEIKESNL